MTKQNSKQHSRYHKVRNPGRRALNGNRFTAAQFNEGKYNAVMRRMRGLFGLSKKQAHSAAWGASFPMQGLADERERRVGR